MKKVIAVLLVAAMGCMTLAGCGKKDNQETPSESQEAKDVNIATDYSDPMNWETNDYNNPEKADTVADVIYLYGTAVTGEVIEDGIIQICDGMRAFVTTEYDASVEAFNDGVRIYLPYWRQLSLETESSCTDTLDCIDTFENSVAGTDLCAFFDYYFENYNEGRPFILAGYSQGGMAVQAMLDMYFGTPEHRAYLDNMIVAYSIGFGVDKEWLSERDYLKFAEGANDTGVICSWNTEGPGEKGVNPLIPAKVENSLVINPINWKTDTTYASAAECLGSYTDDGIVTPGLYNLQIDPERGSVICDNNTDYVDDGTGNMWGGKSLHLYEIKHVYLSIRQNMHDRIDAFLNK